MRTLPAGISLLIGAASTRAPLFLVEIQWPAPAGTRYYSSGEQVTFNGHVFEKNRAMSISSFEAGLIDRKHADFSRLEIKFDNLADNGSSAFPFTTLEAAQNLEDGKVFVHIWSPDANDAIANVWWGYLAGREYDGENKSVTIKASFFWDALDLPMPSKKVHQLGFGPSDPSAQNNEEDIEDIVVPIVYGAGALKVRPFIYRKLVDGSTLHVNFIVSGCNGLPFAAGDVVAAGTKLFSNTAATAVEFLTGSSGQAAPANLSRFPDNAAHPNVAYAYAAFSITSEIKDRIDSMGSHSIKLDLPNGRPLIDTTIPSENPVLILKDFLRDPNFSMGLPSTAFDATPITSAANYAGTRYQMRYEFHEQLSAVDAVQYMLANFHGFISFENGLIQIKCKRNDESSVATFATSDSGVSGRKIHNDFVRVEIKDSSDLINQVTIKYRRKKHMRRAVTLYDPTAQARAGGTQKKVVEDEYDFWENGGIYDETQAQILAAIAVREEQNGNLFIEFSTPFWDGIGIAIGDLITVKSPDIFNNASNQTFRVTKQTPDTEGEYLVHFECQVYKQAIYNDDSTALGVDLLRGGDSTDAQGRPPDVIPISLQVIDTGTGDTEGRQTTIRANFTVPGFDPTAEQTDGIFREAPIAEVEVWWHFTDENINLARLGGSLKVRQVATAQNLFIDFHTDFRRTKSVEVFFVSIGHNRARSPLGYVPDPAKTTYMTAPIDSGPTVAYNVPTSAGFSANDYLICEKEINRIQIIQPTLLVCYFVGAQRTAFFDTVSIAHPARTEVSVAKLSYPSLTISLNVPKFSYPFVSNLRARQQQDAVQFRWDRIIAENRKSYLFYWSIDADALTNPAKLGSTTPAWYLADPETPPAGVFLDLNDDLGHTIHQADIGGPGIIIYARVAAWNGKRNYSSQLSASANSSSTGKGAQPTDAPSAPSLAAIISNVTTIGKQGESTTVIRIFADGSQTKTWAQTGTSEEVLFFRDPQGKDFHVPFVIENPATTFQDFVLHFIAGGAYTHIKNRSKNAGGDLTSASTNIVFAAGDFQTAASLITGLAITAMRPAGDPRHSYVDFQYNQPAKPVALQAEEAYEKLQGEAIFSHEKTREVRGELAVMVAGLITRTIKVNHPKNNIGQYQIRLVSIDGSSILSAAFNFTTPDADTAAPNNGVAINVKRVKLKSGGKLLVNYELPTVQMETYDKSVLILHDNNSTGTGRKVYDPFTSAWVAAYPDGSTELSLAQGTVEGIHIKPSEIFVAGRTQFFVRIGVWNRFNGGTATYSGDLSFPVTQAGSEVDVVSQDTNTPNNAAILAAPIVEANSIGVSVAFVPPTAQMNTHTKNTIRLRVADSGSCYWNGKRGANSVVSGSVIDIDIGKDALKVFNFHKKHIQNAFAQFFGAGAVASQLIVSYTVNNAIGGTISAEKTIVLATDFIDAFGDREAVLGLDVGTFMSVRPLQLLPNHHFLAGSGANILSDWGKWTTAGSRNNITDTSSSISWDFDAHQVIFKAIDRILAADNGDGTVGATRGLEETLTVNDFVTVQYQGKSPNTTFTQLKMRAWIADGLGNSLVSSIPDIDLRPGVPLGNTMQLFGSTFQLTSLPAGADKNLYFALAVISSIPAIDASHWLALDNFGLVGGKTAFPGTQRPKLENRKAYSPTPAASVQIDLANPIGSKGGYFDPNSGGGFTL